MTLNDNTEIVHSEIQEKKKSKFESKNQFRAAFIPPPAGFRNTAGKTFRDSLRKISIIFRSFWNPSPTSFCSWQEKVESKEVLIMPQVFKIAGYTVYFWVNENNPLEPVHVHIAKGVPSPNATKIWITKSGKCLLCHNNSKIPDKQLRIIMQIIEARNKSVIDLWYSTFREIRFYC